MSAYIVSSYRMRVFPTPPNPAFTLEDLTEFHNRRHKLRMFMKSIRNYTDNIEGYVMYLPPSARMEYPSTQYELRSFNRDLRYVPDRYSEVEFDFSSSMNPRRALRTIANFFRDQSTLNFPITVQLTSTPDGIRVREEGVESIEAKPVYVRSASGRYSVEYPDAHYPSWYRASEEDIAMEQRDLEAAARRSDLTSFSPYYKHPRI